MKIDWMGLAISAVIAFAVIVIVGRVPMLRKAATL